MAYRKKTSASVLSVWISADLWEISFAATDGCPVLFGAILLVKSAKTKSPLRCAEASEGAFANPNRVHAYLNEQTYSAMPDSTVISKDDFAGTSKYVPAV